MDTLVGCGCRDFVIVTGFMREKIETFAKARYAGKADITFIHNELYATTNNIYSLWLAVKDSDGQSILLLDSDLLYDPRIVERMISSPAENALALIRHVLGDEEMKVVADAAGRIVAINKTCAPESAAGESLGIEKMGASYVAALRAELRTMMENESLRNVFYEMAFERLIGQGHCFTIEDVTGLRSMELDTIEDFETANRLFSE